MTNNPCGVGEPEVAGTSTQSESPDSKAPTGGAQGSPYLKPWRMELLRLIDEALT